VAVASAALCERRFRQLHDGRFRTFHAPAWQPLRNHLQRQPQLFLIALGRIIHKSRLRLTDDFSQGADASVRLFFHGYRSVNITTRKCLSSHGWRRISRRVAIHYDILEKGHGPCDLASWRLGVNAFVESLRLRGSLPEPTAFFFRSSLVIFGHVWSSSIPIPTGKSVRPFLFSDRFLPAMSRRSLGEGGLVAPKLQPENRRGGRG
jgi:hypothetical protein